MTSLRPHCWSGCPFERMKFFISRFKKFKYQSISFSFSPWLRDYQNSLHITNGFETRCFLLVTPLQQVLAKPGTKIWVNWLWNWICYNMIQIFPVSNPYRHTDTGYFYHQMNQASGVQLNQFIKQCPHCLCLVLLILLHLVWFYWGSSNSLWKLGS